MSFSKTLEDVVNGAKKLEEFTNIIVTSAIEDVLLRVSRDYGLNFTKLVDDYKDDVLDNCTLVGSGNAKCKGFTTTKKPCGRRAVCNGYCRGHSDQGIEKHAKQRQAVSYVSAKSKKGDDPVIASLVRLGADMTVENNMISKSDKLDI